MTNEEAFKLIGKRAEELANDAKVQRKAIEIAQSQGKEAGEKYIYMLAIATLAGI
uniref:Uncharacterized protein n=1 Tax=Dulem virus 39 TaxID=3145757 RepID=A0AAU8B5H5_9CAUD